MYGAGNAYNIYKNNAVNYASKEELLLMLVDGAVKYAKIGRAAIEEKNAKKAHETIVKTENIFYELMSSLDVKKGGDWAHSLMQVYEFIVSRLTEANIHKDTAIMDEVIPFIEDVCDTWHQAYAISKGKQ